jgi:Xaa-Pro aminopeptidase
VAIGDIDREFERIYNIVKDAQLRALEAIKPGITGKEVDKVARDYISDYGYGEYFGHGLGHGVGLNIHENPRLSPQSEVALEEGMVVTVEPGIYIPGRTGVRIEDLVLVTRDGCEILTDVTKELLVIRRLF